MLVRVAAPTPALVRFVVWWWSCGVSFWQYIEAVLRIDCPPCFYLGLSRRALSSSFTNRAPQGLSPPLPTTPTPTPYALAPPAASRVLEISTPDSWWNLALQHS